MHIFSTAVIFETVVREYVLGRSRSTLGEPLSLLSRVQRKKIVGDLPSWVPDLTLRTEENTLQLLATKHYNADDNKRSKRSVDVDALFPTPTLLSIRVVHFDTVFELGTSGQEKCYRAHVGSRKY